MSASVSTATPHLPDLAERELVVGVAAHQRRQVERGRQPVAARGEQLVEAAVGVDRGAEAGEHAHRPELRAVHRRRTARACTGTGPGRSRVVGSVDRRRPARPTSSRSRRRVRRLPRTLPATRRAASPHQVTSPNMLGDAVVAPGRVAAVDRDRLAGHERRVGRHEERGHRRDLLGPAEAAELVLLADVARARLPCPACRTRLRASASR